MGVTIHFEGGLWNEKAFQDAMAEAQRFADQRQWQVAPISNPEALLQRVRGEEGWDYVGPVKGLALQPHENSDPLRLEFDDSLYVQEFIKTQFAPMEVHMDIVRLLKALAPYFEHMEVEDEGEFFETENPAVLEEHFSRVFQALEEHLENNPNHYGPVRLEDGRIVDLIERDEDEGAH